MLRHTSGVGALREGRGDVYARAVCGPPPNSNSERKKPQQQAAGADRTDSLILSQQLSGKIRRPDTCSALVLFKVLNVD